MSDGRRWWMHSSAFLMVVAKLGILGILLAVEAHVWVFAAFIAGVALSFLYFLFSVARDPGGRSLPVALVFVLSNIAVMIIAYGGIYSRLGLADTLRGGGRTSIWDGIYFSIITWTTVGYGDMSPTLATRAVAASEALTGYVVMGLLISVLVVMAQGRR
jgi:hypothetical protein